MASVPALTRVSVLVAVVTVLALPAVAVAHVPAAEPAVTVSESDQRRVAVDTTEAASDRGDLFQAGIVGAEKAGGGSWLVDSLSPIVVSSIVGGFVFGTLLSVALVKRRRIEDRFKSDTPTQSGDRSAANSERSRDSPDRRDDDQSPSGARDDTDGGGDPEFFTDEARVRHLLDRENGRMKQSDIVEETEWSKSKVSRVVSRMDDDDEVLKIGLGRENLICLPGHEPEIASETR